MRVYLLNHIQMLFLVAFLVGCSAPTPRKYEIDDSTQEMLDDMLRDPARYVGASPDDEPDITVESMGEFDKVAQSWRSTEFTFEYLLSDTAYQHHKAEQAFAEATSDPTASDRSISKQLDAINRYRVKMQSLDVQRKREHKRERSIEVSLRFEYSIPDRRCEYHQTALTRQAVHVIYGAPPAYPEGYHDARLLGFRHAAEPFYTDKKLEVWAPRKLRVPACSTCTVTRDAFLKRGS